LYWVLAGLDLDVEQQIVSVAGIEAALVAGLIALSIAAFRDAFNPLVQVSAYALVYFAFAFTSDGSALAAASIAAFLAATALGILAGAMITPLCRPVKVPLVSLRMLRLFLLAVVGGGGLAFGYLVVRLGGVLAYTSRSFELSLVAREEGLEILFLPGTVLVSVVSLWLAYLKKGGLFAAVVAVALVVSILSFRRANVFNLLMAIVLYRHYFVRRIRVATLIPLGGGILTLMLLIGSARYSGLEGVAENGPLGALAGLDRTIYESYTFVLGTKPDYDFLVRSGSSLTAGLRFLLPSFLLDRGDYRTVPDALSAAVYGATTYGTPATMFGSLLIYLPPLLAPLFAIFPGLIWGNVYALMRRREKDRAAFVWYLASVFLAFDFFRTGDVFHSAKVAVILLGTMVPATLVMRPPSTRPRSPERIRGAPLSPILTTRAG
jgi:hypothetical protein